MNPIDGLNLIEVAFACFLFWRFICWVYDKGHQHGEQEAKVAPITQADLDVPRGCIGPTRTLHVIDHDKVVQQGVQQHPRMRNTTYWVTYHN